MKYPKFFVVLALIAVLTVAFMACMTTGCSMFGDSGSEKLTIVKTVAKSALKLVVAAYQAGGSSLATAKIDAMEADGKLSADQATALKSMLDDSVGALKNLANDAAAEDAAKTDTAGTSTEASQSTLNMFIINNLQSERGFKNIAIKACFTSPKEPIVDANIKV